MKTKLVFLASQLTPMLVCFFLTPFLWASSIEVTDSLGRNVNIKIPVERAVIISTTELIPALDIWDFVVGVPRWAEEESDLHRSFTEENPSLRRPKVGEGMDVNVEAVIGVRPQLVITWAVFLQSVKFLEERGITTIAIQPENINELYEAIRLHGILFNREKQAEMVIEEMKKIFNIIHKKVSLIPPSERKTVMITWMRPTTVTGKIGLIRNVLDIIGAKNVSDEIENKTADVSVEHIIKWNPDVIFTWGYANYGPEWFFENKQWQLLKAVKNFRVYKLPMWPITSPRLPLFALFIAMKVYPEHFQDLNFNEIADNFYRNIFGTTLELVKRYEKR